MRLPAPLVSALELRFARLTERDRFDPLGWHREPLHPSPGRQGYWEIDLDVLALPDGDYEYELILDGRTEEPVPDPYAEEIVRFGGYRGLFRIRSARRWRVAFSWDDELPGGVRLPNNNELVIYELPLRWMSGTPEEDDRQVGLGTFDRVIFERLDELAGLGINAIELLPVQDSPDTLNWGYGSRFFFAPDFDMGSPVDLKLLVKRCHQRGIRVFLDVVMNHAKECPLEKLADDWFFLRDGSEEPGRGENWGGRLFRYRRPASDGHHPAREFRYQMAEFWVREFHIDAFASMSSAASTTGSSSRPSATGRLPRSGSNSPTGHSWSSPRTLGDVPGSPRTAPTTRAGSGWWTPCGTCLPRRGTPAAA
jgi:1,4-alpha-glucan branching enzyme